MRAESELSAEDVDRIQHFAVNVRTREEAEITRHPQVMTPRSFMWMCGPVGGPVPKYRNMREGLEATGWAEIPGSIEVGRGAYGHLQLAYKVSESKVPLESRHLCAAKILPLSQHEVGYINNEIKILRGVVHENVVDYFTHYVVENEIEVPHVHILLEYASAGDLMKEMARHPGYHMSEPNARYYTLQIMTGVQ